MMIYKIILFILVLLVFMFLNTKKEISLKLNEKNISIKLASIFSSESKLNIKNDKKYITLLHTLLEYPTLFIPNRKNNSIYVLYFFDIENHLFSIKLDKDNTAINKTYLNRSMKNIILSGQGFKIESLTQIEIDTIVDKINAMSDDEYKYFSIPSLDLGVYKHYITKKRILEILKVGLRQNSDIHSLTIKSSLNNSDPI